MEKILTQNEFFDYIFHEYTPSAYENLDQDARFDAKTNYAHLCATRCYYIYREIVARITADKEKPVTVLDLGVYPGTLLRILKNLLKDHITCYGSGLKVDDNFKQFAATFMSRCENAELDPFYAKSKTVTPIPFEDNSVDIVTATEILEHLISPLHLIAEGTRVLRKGGMFIVTTPNVSHIGSVLRLILGRSNYEPFTCSPMNLPESEWRGHARLYDKHELITLIKQGGCSLIRHRYYLEHGQQYFQATLPQKAAHLFKRILQVVPIYQEGHFAIFQKD